MTTEERQEFAARISQANALRRAAGPGTRLDLDENGELTVKACTLSKFRDGYSPHRNPKTSRNMLRESRLAVYRSVRRKNGRMARDEDYGT